jgi:hypothetical protein
MESKVDQVLIEQHSSSEAGGGTPSSRRLLVIAHTDLWGAGEVSAARGLCAWVALSITLLIAVMLALGY